MCNSFMTIPQHKNHCPRVINLQFFGRSVLSSFQHYLFLVCLIYACSSVILVVQWVRAFAPQAEGLVFYFKISSSRKHFVKPRVIKCEKSVKYNNTTNMKVQLLQFKSTLIYTNGLDNRHILFKSSLGTVRSRKRNENVHSIDSVVYFLRRENKSRETNCQN